MAEPKDDPLVRSVENLRAEKEAVAAKEKKLIEELNAVLKKMGYHVVRIPPRHHDRGGGEGAGKKPGRPPGSGQGQAAKGPGGPPSGKT